MSPAPRTIASEITNQVLDIVEAGSRYSPADDLFYRRLLKSAEALINADPIQGYLNKAYVVHLTGDYEAAKRIYKIVTLLDPNQTDLPRTLSQIAFDLGYFSDAREIYEDDSSTLDGHHISYALNAGIHLGAFRTLQLRIQEAGKMKLRVQDYIDPEMIDRIVNILEFTNTTDDEISSLLDCAGEILRKHKIFPALPQGRHVSSHSELVHMRLFVAGSLERVSKMNLELAELVAAKVEHLPNGFHVNFKWTGQ